MSSACTVYTACPAQSHTPLHTVDMSHSCLLSPTHRYTHVPLIKGPQNGVGKKFKTKRQEVIFFYKNTSRTIKVFYLPTDAQQICFK